MIGKDGKVVGGNGPPGLAFNYTGADVAHRQADPRRSTKGECPNGPFEIALDVDTAEKGGYDVGDTVTLVTPGNPPTMKAKLTGLVEFGNGGLNGATHHDLRRASSCRSSSSAARTSTPPSRSTRPTGVSQRELADAAQKVLPEGVEARTGDVYVEENKEASTRSSASSRPSCWSSPASRWSSAPS